LFAQFDDVGAGEDAAFEIADRAVVAPDVIEIAGVAIGHRLD
jgi:hypothetical protein